jgi:phosphoglycerol transferase MdoB-like AlkP superfamily enzyme
LAEPIVNPATVADGFWVKEFKGRERIRRWLSKPPVRVGISLIVTLLLAAALTFAVELIARGSLSSTLAFFADIHRPAWTTVCLFALIALSIDAVLGRAYGWLLILAPLVLIPAWISSQKGIYLSDPFYPTDLLYARQIVELLPLLISDRPGTAAAIVTALTAGIVLFVVAFVKWRRRAPKLSRKARFVRLALALPALFAFVPIMDYATFSWVRDRLQIIPMMWDQKENYTFNGFVLAFALNLPMANVSAPAGYSAEAIDGIPGFPVASVPADKPDIIIVMSESFWDPTRLPGVTITPDPIPTARSVSSGSMFSPEFGGMTANVEFEALTGFSNAFLPYGSIPYQQYVHRKIPSLATFLKDEGYATRALHPFVEWFWNRAPVYKAFGFERFLSEERMPPLKKRGPLASDIAFTEEIIRQAELTKEPFFFFAVTLQGHGPYEPNRYPDATQKVDARVSAWARGSIRTYSEGVADADRGLKRLIDWASKRDRKTVIAFFGDHLPSLGPVYVETGFMKEPVASRRAPPAVMAVEHETPLVIWSNRGGRVKDLGATSPAFLPLQVLRTAGIKHPYYTGFLGRMHDAFRVVDRNLLIGADGKPFPDWARKKKIDPAIRDFRLLQFDIMFGRRDGTRKFFPELEPVSG